MLAWIAKETNQAGQPGGRSETRLSRAGAMRQRREEGTGGAAAQLRSLHRTSSGRVRARRRHFVGSILAIFFVIRQRSQSYGPLRNRFLAGDSELRRGTGAFAAQRSIEYQGRCGIFIAPQSNTDLRPSWSLLYTLLAAAQPIDLCHP
jgi:hypothetical protein